MLAAGDRKIVRCSIGLYGTIKMMKMGGLSGGIYESEFGLFFNRLFLNLIMFFFC